MHNLPTNPADTPLARNLLLALYDNNAVDIESACVLDGIAAEWGGDPAGSPEAMNPLVEALEKGGMIQAIWLMFSVAPMHARKAWLTPAGQAAVEQSLA